MPRGSPQNTTSDSLSEYDDFEDLDDFDDFDNEDVDIYELEADVEDLEPYVEEINESELLKKDRRELINILVQGDEDALNNWLIKLNRSWNQEEIISDVLFLALQCSSFPFLSLLFTKVFRELSLAQMDDSPIFIKELDLLTYHYNARNFTISFNEFIQKALLPSPNIGLLTIQEENAIKISAEVLTELSDVSSAQGVALVFNTLFSWVKAVGEQGERFMMLKDSALDEDASRRPYWSSFFGGATSKKEEIDGYFHKHDVVTALALTFFNGRLTSTASEHLFLKIIQEIKKDIKKEPELVKEPGYALIALFNEEAHKRLYFRHFHDAIIESRITEKTEPKLLSQSSPY
ncbi:hypothetical protein [Legionella rowbothamii]|uniref:hypothetical protein n=1 Tax=Legionella rowbothamii TaxID=96229 RepID=UPI001056535C|nr:hypothetical protein [Legionella rowbothamii]